MSWKQRVKGSQAVEEGKHEKTILLDNLSRARKELARSKQKIRTLELELAAKADESAHLRSKQALVDKRGKGALRVTDAVPNNARGTVSGPGQMQVQGSAAVALRRGLISRPSSLNSEVKLQREDTWTYADRIFSPQWKPRPQSAPPSKSQATPNTSNKTFAAPSPSPSRLLSPTDAKSPAFLAVTGEKAIKKRGLLFRDSKRAARKDAESEYVGLGRAMARLGGNPEEEEGGKEAKAGDPEQGKQDQKTAWSAAAQVHGNRTLRSYPLALTTTPDLAPSSSSDAPATMPSHSARPASPLSLTPARRARSPPGSGSKTARRTSRSPPRPPLPLDALPEHLRTSRAGMWESAPGWQDLCTASRAPLSLSPGHSLDSTPPPVLPRPRQRPRSAGGRMSHESFKWHVARDSSRRGDTGDGSGPTGAGRVRGHIQNRSTPAARLNQEEGESPRSTRPLLSVASVRRGAREAGGAGLSLSPHRHGVKAEVVQASKALATAREAWRVAAMEAMSVGPEVELLQRTIMENEVKLARVSRNVKEREAAVDLQEWRQSWKKVLMMPWAKQEGLCNELDIQLSELKEYGDVQWAADVARRVAGAMREKKLARLKEEQTSLTDTLEAQRAKLEGLEHCLERRRATEAELRARLQRLKREWTQLHAKARDSEASTITARVRGEETEAGADDATTLEAEETAEKQTGTDGPGAAFQRPAHVDDELRLSDLAGGNDDRSSPKRSSAGGGALLSRGLKHRGLSLQDETGELEAAAEEADQILVQGVTSAGIPYVTPQTKADASWRMMLKSGKQLDVGQLTLAIQLCNVAVRLDPSNLTAWQNLSVLIVLSGDVAGGRQQLEEVVSERSGHAAALFNVGVLKHMAGDEDGAVLCYERARVSMKHVKAMQTEAKKGLKRRGGADVAAQGEASRRCLKASVLCARAAAAVLQQRLGCGESSAERAGGREKRQSASDDKGEDEGNGVSGEEGFAMLKQAAKLVGGRVEEAMSTNSKAGTSEEGRDDHQSKFVEAMRRRRLDRRRNLEEERYRAARMRGKSNGSGPKSSHSNSDSRSPTDAAQIDASPGGHGEPPSDLEEGEDPEMSGASMFSERVLGRSPCSADERTVGANVLTCAGAQLELMAGREDDAKRLYCYACDLDPANEVALCCLTLLVARMQGGLQEETPAWDLMERALRMEPDGFHAQLTSGWLLRWGGPANAKTDDVDRGSQVKEIEAHAKALGAARRRAKAAVQKRRSQAGTMQMSVMELWMAGKLDQRHLKRFDSTGNVVQAAEVSAATSTMNASQSETNLSGGNTDGRDRGANDGNAASGMSPLDERARQNHSASSAAGGAEGETQQETPPMENSSQSNGAANERGGLGGGQGHEKDTREEGEGEQGALSLVRTWSGRELERTDSGRELEREGGLPIVVGGGRACQLLRQAASSAVSVRPIPPRRLMTAFLTRRHRDEAG